jgi:hypothetical protein
MNIYLNTSFNLSQKMLKQYISKSNDITIVDINIIQVNFNDSALCISLINATNDAHKQLLNKFKTINGNLNNLNKCLFNKLCLLYFNGGIIINTNVLLNDLSDVVKLYKQYDFCSIKSCINNIIFDGLIMSKNENSLIGNILNTFVDNFVDNNPTLSELLTLHTSQNVNALLLNEIINNNISNIYWETNMIAQHFIGDSILVDRLPIPKQKQKQSNLHKLKIGITINLPSDIKSFYSNGIKQNCLYLYELLNNIGYDVKLIIDKDEYISVLKQIDFYNFEYVTLNNIFSYDFDLIFSMGFSIPNEIFKSLKNIGVKIVYYMCGNNYLIDCEKILYNQHKTRTICYDELNYDEVWIIPQMYNQNKYYMQILHKSKCIQIPFIWSPMSIKFIQKIMNLENDTSLLYKKKETKIGIFEPNISVMKWALPSILIAENANRNYNNISHIYITNMYKKEDTINNFNMVEFNNVCKNLSLFKERKLSIEGRYVTLEMMSKNCDIAISHQWENPLNYLYLELAWMGWPILHNAHLCKDVGYYYEGFNYDDASEKLNDIILNHDVNKYAYLKQNRDIIDNYTPSNIQLQIKYTKLIENIMK